MTLTGTHGAQSPHSSLKGIIIISAVLIGILFIVLIVPLSDRGKKDKETALKNAAQKFRATIEPGALLVKKNGSRPRLVVKVDSSGYICASTERLYCQSTATPADVRGYARDLVGDYMAIPPGAPEYPAAMDALINNEQHNPPR